MPSMTSISTGPLPDSSLRPSCSWIARSVNRAGQAVPGADYGADRDAADSAPLLARAVLLAASIYAGIHNDAVQTGRGLRSVAECRLSRIPRRKASCTRSSASAPTYRNGRSL